MTTEYAFSGTGTGTGIDTEAARAGLFVCPEEAAGVLGCSSRTIVRMFEAGKLKGCRAGNRVRINRRALLEYAGLL